MLKNNENRFAKTDLKTMKKNNENIASWSTALNLELWLKCLAFNFVKVYKCVLLKDIDKEKCLHTTIFPFQCIDSKSENNKDENLFEGHGHSCFREARI